MNIEIKRCLFSRGSQDEFVEEVEDLLEAESIISGDRMPRWFNHIVNWFYHPYIKDPSFIFFKKSVLCKYIKISQEHSSGQASHFNLQLNCFPAGSSSTGRPPRTHQRPRRTQPHLLLLQQLALQADLHCHPARDLSICFDCSPSLNLPLHLFVWPLQILSCP